MARSVKTPRELNAAQRELDSTRRLADSRESELGRIDDAIAEAAVIGCPHDIKGQAIYAYVIPMKGVSITDELLIELKAIVTSQVGAFARPDFIQVTNGLPKTRSGKIMRRILRKIACDELDTLGDTSTLADPSVVDSLIEQRLNRAG